MKHPLDLKETHSSLKSPFLGLKSQFLGIFLKKLLTTFWVSILLELEILQRTSQKWKNENPLILVDFRAKSWIFLIAPGKIGKIEKNQKFDFWGFFMNVFIGFWGLDQIFSPKLKLNKQKSHDRSISWF